LNQLVEAERQVTGEQAQPAGVLRISTPTTYAHHRLLPLLPAFRAKYPLIKVEVHISNRNVDLHNENFDCAVRVRPQPDSTTVARLLENAPLVLVASPAYLERRGAPKNLADLERHECIQFELPSSGRVIGWLFNEGSDEKELFLASNYTCVEDVLGGVTLAASGAGLFQTYRFVVEKQLIDGMLIEVLQNFGGRSRPFSLLYPHGRLLPSRVRAFVDFLMEQTQRLQRAQAGASTKLTTKHRTR
jgi:DNA-binding transcriptional LysR family regulator